MFQIRNFQPLRVCRSALAAAALALLSSWSAADGANTSVPYVPTPQPVVDRMLQIANIGAQDYLIDLGSGDGRIVVTAAAKHKARGFGVDLNPTRIAEAEENARKAGVTDRVAFYQRDLFETDLTQASVITMYLLPRVNLELRPKLLELKPGTRIVSHDFSMDDWKPDHHEDIDAPGKYGGSGGRSDIYLWIVPAQVGGTWQSELSLRGKPLNYEIALQQQFQAVTGTVKVGGRTVPLQNTKLRGEQLSFEFTADVAGAPVKHVFSGTVTGALLSGTADLNGARVQARQDWSARRSSRSAAHDAGVHGEAPTARVVQ